MLGNERAADALELKAAAAPAMTGVASWASELLSAGLRPY